MSPVLSLRVTCAREDEGPEIPVALGDAVALVEGRVAMSPGRAAGRIAAAALSEVWAEPVSISERLRRIPDRIQAAFHAELVQKPARGQLVAHLALLALAPDRAHVAHIGLTRIYRVRGRELVCLTRDHSLANEALAAGSPPGEAGRWSHHVVTRALSTSAPASALEVQEIQPQPGDRYWLIPYRLVELMADDLNAGLLEADTQAGIERLRAHCARLPRGAHVGLVAVDLE